MIRKLMAANVALLAILALLGWALHRKIQDTHRREEAILRWAAGPVNLPPPPELKSAPPLDAAAFQDAVNKNLFSKDRNPIPIPDPPPPPPPPPEPPAFPVARGVMLWEGAPPTVVLSLKGSNTQKGYHPGETIGDWKIVSVDNQYLTLEWNGKQFKKRLDELMDRTPVVVAEAPPPQAAAAAGQPASQNLAQSKNGQGVDIGGGMKACVAGDTQPAGTVVDGMKKVVSQTPFGSTCRWEAVQ